MTDKIIEIIESQVDIDSEFVEIVNNNFRDII